MAGITHAKNCKIASWTQAMLDQAIAIGLFPVGTKIADIVLSGDWNADHALPPLLVMQGQGANIVTKNADYVATDADYTIEVDAASGPVQITLPITKYQLFNVIKVDNTANTVTIIPASGNISGAANKTLSTQWNSLAFQGNGTNLRVI